MAEFITSEMVSSFCPDRPEDGHKGTFGTVLIIAGSRYMSGAQTLAAMSALRSGAGMVRVYAPDDSLDSTRINCPCALLSPWGESETSAIRAFDGYMKKATAAAIGPGIDEADPRSLALLEHALMTSSRIVVDAGALNLIAHNRERLMPLLAARADIEGFEPAVLTPHKGEFRRLIRTSEDMPDEETEDRCAEFAVKNRCILAVKSHKTVVSDDTGKCYINTIGGSGLAKGGSGDVLTGLIAGLCAQKMPSTRAAISGVYLHALSGDLASVDIGRRVMIPEDLPGYFDEAFASTGWI